MKGFIKAAGIIAGIAGICTIAGGIWYLVAHKYLCVGAFAPKNAASIGIIGGADGPTSILISDKSLIARLLAALLELAALLGSLVIRKKLHARIK